MKKILKTSFIYLTCGIVFEVVLAGILEMTRTKAVGVGIMARPMALIIHTHFLALGFAFFLMVALLEKVFVISDKKNYKLFFSTYNIGLAISIIIIGYRSFAEIFLYPVNTIFAMAVGTIGHILLTIGMYLFFDCVKKSALDISN